MKSPTQQEDEQDGDLPKLTHVEEHQFRSKAACKHNRITVDEERYLVECSDCHQHLEPMLVLLRFAREETRLERLREAHRKEEVRRKKEMQDRKSIRQQSCKHTKARPMYFFPARMHCPSCLLEWDVPVAKTGDSQ